MAPTRLADDETILALHRKGLSPEEIGVRLGIRKDTINRHLARLVGPSKPYNAPKREQNRDAKAEVKTLSADSRKYLTEVDGITISLPRTNNENYWREWART